MKFRQPMPGHDYYASIQGDERGDRIAVDIITSRGGNRALDISPHMTARRIVVYDIEAGRELASVPEKIPRRNVFGFDLSPDGRRLAILGDDKVTVVDIDEPPAAE